MFQMFYIKSAKDFYNFRKFFICLIGGYTIAVYERQHFLHTP